MVNTMSSIGRTRCILITVFAVLAGLALANGAALAAKSGGTSVMSPQTQPYGSSYAEWAARWWQWALSIPIHDENGNILNPLFDQTGSQASIGQSGHVWFLAGVVNESGSAIRNVTIPSGTALFVPVINAECSTVEAPPFYGGNEEALRACATSYIFGDLRAELDSQPITDLASYEISSILFDFSLPEDNILGIAGGQSGQSVDHGVYLMLKPLPVGTHTLHFSGTFVNFDFTLDITYNITVVPHGRYGRN
jgi:hypothetical protein